MSGGVGPTCDIALAGDESESKAQSAAPRRRGFFTYHHLNSAAIVIVLSASGMIAMEDVLFVLLSSLYLLFISKFSFPSDPSDPDPPVFGERNRILGVYVLVGAAVGVFLPVAYVFGGILEGDKEGIRAAAPHLFLLACQILAEGVSFAGGFSLPIRVFVPVLYNSRRMLSIWEWLRDEFSKSSDGGGRRSMVAFGRGLAAANLGFWSFNLLGFLLPFYLPKAFRIYYSKNKTK
ncbi:hypothetical protein M569_17116 [Genlisea aurea]|uniref:DUF7733 domain-containing protein n=1 Tax=Genlisea aurea TaxID=192259 RepID=S8BZQ8_9LAMI|nr:hypothetical protein M569_17116 [Genlisea aurea]